MVEVRNLNRFILNKGLEDDCKVAQKCAKILTKYSFTDFFEENFGLI